MSIAMDVLLLLAGVGVFMYGMKQMSNGMEQSAGAGVRSLFKKLSKNRFTDYALGVGTTVVVQSSSATSIMTVGLANAGIVNVKQGSGIILGAKVGTTFSAFIFALSGISKGSFSIGTLFASLAFVGVIISMTTSKDSLKKLALFLIGFGLLFLGLEVMESAIGGKDSVLSMQISKLFQYESMKNPILLVLIGVLFTCVIQSSTAAVGVFIAFLKTGLLSSIDQSFFLVMGANIGTCLDGAMASIGANVNGKRIAFFHVTTSTIGAVAFSIILTIFRSPIVNAFNSLFEKPEWSLAIFNLVYNLLYTLAMLCLLNQLVSLTNRVVAEKSQRLEKELGFDERLLATPAVAVSHALTETNKMAEKAFANYERAFKSMMTEDMSHSKEIAKTEYEIDALTRSIASFIIKISAKPISYNDERLIGGLHHVINDIERIGDHAVNIAKETNYMQSQDLHFHKQTIEELEEVYSKLHKLYELCMQSFKGRKTTQLKNISTLHQEILEDINQKKNLHTERLNSGVYSVEVSKPLYAVLLSLQRASDHLVNVGFSIISDTGSKTEGFKKLETAKAKQQK